MQRSSAGREKYTAAERSPAVCSNLRAAWCVAGQACTRRPRTSCFGRACQPAWAKHGGLPYARATLKPGESAVWNNSRILSLPLAALFLVLAIGAPSHAHDAGQQGQTAEKAESKK